MSGQLTPQDVELEAHREEKRLLSVEAERLRAELRHATEQHVAMQTELDRLREELKETSGIQAMGRLNAKLRDQRDALADALLWLRQFLGVFLCHDGDGNWRIASDIEPGDSVSGAPIEAADDALRLVGRLPKEGS